MLAKKNPKKKAKRPSPKIWQFYKIENGALIRTHRFCPRCGRGVFMADHGDRWACGKCGFTEFKTPNTA